MSELGFKNNTLVYHGESFLGELCTIPIEDTKFQFPNNEIRIHHISPNSERCSPLSLLQTIASSSSSSSIRCKLESNSHVDQHHLINLHASCFHELKTAVVIIGDEEVHLVAMQSKLKKYPCFWCYSVPSGLYVSCLGMLNMRCLSIVFDLDETLIVANTMKSFEDRIDMLRSWIVRETDPARVSGMSAELKRYMDDRALLKQYLESDCVVDNGKMLKVQFEEVSSDNPERVLRPVIRLQDRNVVLTRINPEIRDTSVLVRLRPAWEDLRSYLIAKGRKRFEVYVCTMAERDYALEMWRLLDPGAHLIGHKQLLSRVVCVKSGSRKSLLNVFQNGICHPKMAMVIDDRAKVWEDKDQPRVHVVPPFTPYYAPQAETANAVPVLCVARNVACNVRGGFFKEFDENFSRRIYELFYEDEVVNLPSAPDVSNYLMSEVYEEGGFLLNGNNNPPMQEGMTGFEVERRWNQSDERNVAGSVCHPTEIISDLRYDTSLPAGMSAQKPSLLGAPAQRDGMKLGQDLRNQSSGDPPILARPPSQASMPFNQNPFYHSSSSSTASGLLSHPSQVKGEEASVGPEWKRQYLPAISQPSEVRVPQNQVSSCGRVLQTEAGKMNSLPSSLSVGVLQEIGKRCSSKVEFRPVISTSKDLQFAVEVLFTGEKIGVGMGKTRKDAQQQAAENALHILAEKYVAHVIPHSGVVNKDFDKLSVGKENGILWEVVNPELNKQLSGNGMPKESSLEVAEAALANTSSTVINQLVQKRANSPRSPQSIPNKRFKEEPFHGSQNLLSSRLQKNGNPIT